MTWVYDTLPAFRQIAPGARPRRAGIITVVVAMTAVTAPFAVSADDGTAAAPESESPLHTLIDQTLPEFSLLGGARRDEPLEIASRLRWDNPSRGSESGLTVIYSLRGRAEAVLCVYPWAGRLVHDFSSLSRGTLVGRHDDMTFWNPAQPGTTFRPVPDAEVPAEIPAARLRQMKTLARDRFDAMLRGWRLDDADRQPLRLLPRPVYRYKPAEGVVVDGAVFAYVMGVDPEALLLIEAVSDEKGRRWEYGFVRRSSGELQARLDGEIVWSAERYPPDADPTGLLRRVTRPLPPEALPAVEAVPESPPLQTIDGARP
jgi:hypothetical protein